MTWNEGDLTLNVPSPSALLTIQAEDGEMLVTVKPDGSVEFGENYEPERAARIFWEAIGSCFGEHFEPAK